MSSEAVVESGEKGMLMKEGGSGLIRPGKVKG